MSEETGWQSTPRDFRQAPKSPERRPTGDIPEIYEFGPFRLEPAERKLLRGNEVVAVTPKAFDTLLLLVRNSGHLLEKDELIRMLWPHSVVEEGNLTTNIFLLRKALGEGPEYIETVPRKGYRFVGAVRRLPTAELARPDILRDAESEPEANVSSARQPTMSLDLTHEPATTRAQHNAAPLPGEQVATAPWSKPALITTAALVAIGALAYVAIDKAWLSKHQASPPTPPTAPASSPSAVFAPPPHSIAVLPFVNLSGDKDQEYFSEGLTEELLDSLSRINDLQVAARTSSFSFQGEHPDIATVAHKLNVGAVLEGSVRRSGNTVRISAQLVNALTGFHVWSQTYDRDLGDALKLQTEIATAVAGALKVTLLGDTSQKIELGGTRSAAAFDAYVRALSSDRSRHEPKDDPDIIAAYSEAISLDPNFALAYAGRSTVLTDYASRAVTGAASRETFQKAEGDARRAIAFAPELADANVALGSVLESGMLDFAGAREAFERALGRGPGNARVQRYSGVFFALMGDFDTAIAATHRAVVLDPLSRGSHFDLGRTLYLARRYQDATTAFTEAITLAPDFKPLYGFRGFTFYAVGNFESARASCETKRDYWLSQVCLAVAYSKIGRRADADAELAKIKTALEDAGAYQYAEIYAQWGDRPRALDWLGTAMRLRDSGLLYLKTDPLMDPLRQEPRFQAVMRELKFPSN